MRVQSLLAAVLGMFLLASSANAAFTISAVRGPSTLAGYEFIKLYALNTGGTTGVGVQAVDIKVETLDVTKFLKIQFGNVGGTTAADADIYGFGPTNYDGDNFAPFNVGSYVGTDLGVGWDSVTKTDANDTYPDPSPTNYPILRTATYNPTTDVNWTQNKSFRVVGAMLSAAAAAPADASQNGGRGAAIATAVVPIGTGVKFTGKVGGTLGSKQSFVMEDPIPEPASMSLLALGAMAFLGRRSRKA